MSVTFRHSDLLIILIHFWEWVAILMQFFADTVPPHREMFLYWSSQVGSMRSWLTHYFMEWSTWSCPICCIYTQESSNSGSNRESENPLLRVTLEYWSHKWESQQVSEDAMSYSLSTEFLQLTKVEFFHLQDFPFSEVIIINVSEPVPILVRSDGAVVISRSEPSVEGNRIQFSL